MAAQSATLYLNMAGILIIIPCGLSWRIQRSGVLLSADDASTNGGGDQSCVPVFDRTISTR